MESPTQEVIMQFDITKPASAGPNKYIPVFSIKRAIMVHVLRVVIMTWVASLGSVVLRLFVNSFM